MKLKYFLITGISLMFVGGILAGITYNAGAQKSLAWENGPKLLDIAQETKKIDDVEQIMIHAEYQQVTIKRGLNFEVAMSYEKAERPQLTVKNKRLSIIANKKPHHAMIDLDDAEAELTITIPKDIKLSELQIESSNSAIEIDELTSQNVVLNTYDGWATIKELTADSLIADDKLGAFSLISSNIQSMKASASDSRFYLTRLDQGSSGTVDMQNSQLTLHEMETGGYDIQLEGDSRIERNDEEVASSPFSQGKKKISITGKNSMVQITTDEEELED
ncbi:DUF4097 family beta strand repeat-containing protein [Enterococcus sp. ZJ1668]|uniref:DUF4097 family beta strand repeat-containing protein n=1 Tax=Enterococcus sp. ZJ1668 TaxID=2709402 RepID=UPI0013EA4A62|nr:DUF4097 family beta strand repeat-containing protein [Enterococcus sp. ZJ1668]